MSQKHNPRTILVRLVLNEIRESNNGEALAVCVTESGKKYEIPYENIICLEPVTPNSAKTHAISS